MRRLARPTPLALALCLALACSSRDAPPTADAGRDAGADAGTDAGADTGRDAGTDAGTDGGADAGTDAESATDAAAVEDAGEVQDASAAGDAGAGPDAGPDRDAGPEPDAGPATCDDLLGTDFGLCGRVLGYGMRAGACMLISGCDDLGVPLFATLEECLGTCRARCTDVTAVDFGDCLAALGAAIVGGRCEAVSGCDDRGVPLFASVEQCELVCKGRSCDELQAAYTDLVSTSAATRCGDASECQLLSGHCGVGLGGCFYGTNGSVAQADLDDLARRWVAAGCAEGAAVCDCAVPSGVRCDAGGCLATF